MGSQGMPKKPQLNPGSDCSAIVPILGSSYIHLTQARVIWEGGGGAQLRNTSIISGCRQACREFS